ncbi:MAG TPA: hypothetical protein VHO69_15070 [Phototrophicaceae bacterium]|nr:hypothetical protein [Phototrophicaceae bacterium]
MNRLWRAQLLGVARYELRMFWRGPTLAVLLLMILMLTAAMALIVGVSRDNEMIQTAMPSWVSDQIGSLVAGASWAAVCLVLVFFLPVFAADLIPKDRQLGIQDLLDSTPLPGSAYLGGKLLGLWAGVLLGLAVILGPVVLLFRFAFGEFNPRFLFETWAVGAVALVILNGGLGVLLPFALTTRRQAVTVTIIVLVVSFFFGSGNPIGTYFSAVRAPLIMYFMAQLVPDNPSLITVFTRWDIGVCLLAGLAELVVLGGLAQLGLRWQRYRM